MSNLSPELLRRIDSLDGCAGRWILDLRDDDNRGYDLHCCPGYVYRVGAFNTPTEAAAYCASQHWRHARLLFTADKLNDDRSWPGGYDAPSIYRSNARVFRDDFKRELERADGDADGIALDVRFVTDEMFETITALEDYPLISDDDHSELEIELQDEAWANWAANDWRDVVRDAMAEYCPAEILDAAEYGPSTAKFWADDVLDAIPDDRLSLKLRDLFNACCEQTNTYWFEDGTDQWVDLKRAAEGIARDDLADLTGLTLLAPAVLA